MILLWCNMCTYISLAHVELLIVDCFFTCKREVLYGQPKIYAERSSTCNFLGGRNRITIFPTHFHVFICYNAHILIRNEKNDAGILGQRKDFAVQIVVTQQWNCRWRHARTQNPLWAFFGDLGASFSCWQDRSCDCSGSKGCSQCTLCLLSRGDSSIPSHPMLFNINPSNEFLLFRFLTH